MALSEEQKFKLRALGLNPDEYEMDDGTSITPTHSSGIPESSELSLSPPRVKTTGTEAFVRTAINAAPATVVGGSVAGATLPAATALAPFTWGTSYLIPLVAGGLAGWGAKKLQDKAMDKIIPEYNREIGMLQQQHPYASGAGALATLPLGGFNPSLKGMMPLLTAPKTIPRIMQGLATKEEILPLIGAGSSAGLNAVQDIGLQKLESPGGDIDYGSVLKSAAMGALFNKPNRFASLYGLAPKTPIDVPIRDAGNPELARLKAQYPEEFAERRQLLLPEITESTIRENLINADKTLRYVTELAKQRATAPREEVAERLVPSGMPSAEKAEIVEALKARNKVPDVEPTGQKENKEIPIIDGDVLRLESEVTKLESQLRTMPLAERVQVQKNLDDAKAALNQYKQQRQNPAYDENRTLSVPTEQATRPEQSTEITPVESGSKKEEVESGKLGFRQPFKTPSIAAEEGKTSFFAQPKAEEVKVDKTPLKTAADKAAIGDESLYQAQSVETLLSDNPDFQKYSQDMANKLGISLEEVRNLKDKDGNHVAGISWIKDRIAQWNPDKAGIDTGLHEIAHIFARDLKNSNPELYKKGVEIFGSEEALIEATGLRASEIAKAKIENSWKNRAVNWLKDFWSSIKHKFGSASETDIARIFSREMLKAAEANPQPKEVATSPRAKFIGGFTNPKTGKEFKMYNLLQDVTNPKTGEAHTKDSTVGQRTIEESGIQVTEDVPVYQKVSSLLKSNVDKIRENKELANDETRSFVADQFDSFFAEKDYLEGKFKNRIGGLIRDTGLSDESLSRVNEYMQDIDDTGSSPIKLSSEEFKLEKEIRTFLRDIRDYQNKETSIKVVTPSKKIRTAGFNPDYFPDVIAPAVIDEWTSRPNSVESKRYKQDWIQHAEAVDPKLASLGKSGLKESEELLRNYIAALGNDKTAAIEFGALRKAEGIGLPKELRDPSLMSALTRYSRRASSDFAFNRNLETDKQIRYALNISEQDGSKPKPIKFTSGSDVEQVSSHKDVQALMRRVIGEGDYSNPRLAAGSRFISSGLMGIGTGLRDLATIPANAMPYVTVKDLPAFASAFARFGEARKKAFETNAVKLNHGDLLAGDAYASHPDKVVDTFTKMSDMLRKYQGRELTENVGRVYTYALGEELALANIGRARKDGDVSSIDWINRFGKNLLKQSEIDNLVHGSGPVDEVVLSKISKEFVDAVQGSYDARNLPNWALEGNVAPFFSLARWGIEKANVINKDVIQPLKAGDFAPLLRYTLGTILTGAAIEKLNEILSNKRASDPTIKEVTESPSSNDEEKVLKIISLMQLGSFAGIVGDSLKLAGDAYKGQPTQRSPINYPLYTFVSDTIGNNVVDAVAALKDGANVTDVGPQLVQKILEEWIQNVRLAGNHIWNAEEVERSQKFRDVRTFKRMEGETSNKFQEYNPFIKREEKEFKRTSDVNEIADLVPTVISNALDRAKGDPEKMIKNLRGLRINSYQVMPDPEDNPLMASRFIQHIRATQGDAAVQALVQDYYRQKTLNQVKADLIPKF